jgi:ankyrin repeat protein
MAAAAARNTIFKAAADGDAGVVARMLDEDPQLLLFPDDDHVHTSLLMRAAWMGHVGVVRVLLERGADVSAQDDDGDTALHCAAMTGREEIVSLLLTNGADIHSRGNMGRTALICASQDGNLAVVRLLVRHLGGRGVDDRDENGCTALGYACISGRGHAAIFRVLLLSGADHTIPNVNGVTPQEMIQECCCHECPGLMEVSIPPHRHVQHILA